MTSNLAPAPLEPARHLAGWRPPVRVCPSLGLAAAAVGLLVADPACAQAPAPEGGLPMVSWASAETQAAPQFALKGASTLGKGIFGMGLGIGFPTVDTQVQFGVHDAVDLTLAYSTVYGTQAIVDAGVKATIRRSDDGAFAAAVRLNGGYSSTRPDQTAVEAWNGQRDFAVHPGFVISTTTSKGHTLFTDVGFRVNLDVLELDPRGTPSNRPDDEERASLVASLTTPITFGAEWRISSHANFSTVGGVFVNYDPKDAIAMPFFSVGPAFCF